jgi:hypothetical protein
LNPSNSRKKHSDKSWRKEKFKKKSCGGKNSIHGSKRETETPSFSIGPPSKEGTPIISLNSLQRMGKPDTLMRIWKKRWLTIIKTS